MATLTVISNILKYGLSSIGIFYFVSKVLRWYRRNSIKDKVVLITGASSGLGEACAKLFHKEGARLILCNRNIHQLKLLQSNLTTHTSSGQHTPHVIQLDLGQPDSIERCVREAIAIYGRVDVLVNNAGISSRSLALDTDIAVDRRVMEINYFGTITLTKALLPSMVSKRSGHIVVISSVQGMIGIPNRTSYSASKHALQGYFDALRCEVTAEGISVSVISPGYIRTHLSHNALRGDGSTHGMLDDTTAKGRSPDAVAMVILDTIQHCDREVTVAGTATKAAVHLKYLFPGLLDWILVKRAKLQQRHHD